MGKIQPVILAGGTGSRLWPLSRELYPKQLLQLTDDTSLLQTTVLRVNQLPEVLPPIIVVGEDHRFITLSQVAEIAVVDEFTIMLEPMGKNTAPAICAAAEYCKDLGDDVTLLVLPADHVIMNDDKFAEAVKQASELADNGSVVTFGIQPNCPETGYGYIEKGEGVEVISFKEKPDLAVAQQYLVKGNYFWNSGMFAFSTQTLLEEMMQFSPEIVACMREAVEKGSADGHFYRLDRSAMARCGSDSIDYALMEKTAKAAVVVADIGWSDIGSWKALWQCRKR